MVTKGRIKVVIADDHRLVRESLRLVLYGEANIKVVGEASNGPEAIDVVSKLKPDVALIDIYTPGMDGLDVLRPIKEKSPKTKVLFLILAMDEDMIFETLKAGAKGVISKDASISDLTKAIHTVHEGELWVERKLISRFIDEEALAEFRGEEGLKTPGEALTRREEEVLHHLTTGCTNKEIAEALFISEKTVKSHLNSIFRKLNVTRRLQAILFAINKGLT
jgi:DNA-binding NarL/FixJ family response regulator